MGQTDSKPNQGAHDASLTLSMDAEFLEINGRHLVAFPMQLNQLTKLKTLSLAHNNIQKLDGVSQVLTLEDLDLSYNSLQLLSDELYHVVNLKKLNISFNQLQSIGANIALLKQLKVLNLSNNQLVAIPKEIGQSLSLQIINISFNKLEALPKEIGLLNQLTKLVLNNNKIGTLPSDIGKLGQLTLLDLAENELKSLPHEIGQLKQLAKLYLDNNDFLVLPSEVGQLSELKELNLRSNQLVDLPSSMHKLTKLTLVDLEDNQWESSQYQATDIPQLLAFLKTKRDIVNKSRKATSKEYRRTLERQKVEEKKRNSINTLFETEFTFIGNKKLFYRIVEDSVKVVVIRQNLTECRVNDSDCFILDIGKQIYVFLGSYSSQRKRLKSTHFAELMLKESSAKELIVMDNKTKREDQSDFWKQLGGKYSVSKEAEIDDQSTLDDRMLMIKMFKFTEDKGGRIDIQAYMGEELYRSMLESSSCAVLDTGSDIFVWSGTYSTMNEKSWSMLKAEEMLGHRRDSAEILWIMQGEESLIFREHFVDWIDYAWDPEWVRRLKAQNEEEEMLRAEAERERMRMEKEELEMAEKELERERQEKEQNQILKQQQQQQQQQTQTTTVVVQPTTTSSPSSEPKSERERLKEREKEKIRERQRQRESSANQLPTSATSTPSLTPTPMTPAPSSPVVLPNLPITEPKKTESVSKPEPVVAPVKQPAAVTQPTATVSPKQEPAKSTTISLPVVTKPAAVVTPPAVTTTPTKTAVTPTPTVTPKQEPIKQEPIKQEPVKVQPTTTVSISNESPIVPEQNVNLLAPLPEKAGSIARKPATKNPIRARQERAAAEEEAAKLREKNEKRKSTTSATGTTGLLQALSSDAEKMFMKRREEAENRGQQGITALINLAPKDQPKLLHVKGRRSPFVRQVELSYLSLNSGDVFILDCGKEMNLLYQWNGSEANRIEKGKGMDISKSIKDKERVGCRVLLIDEGKEPDEFWKVLGGKGPIADASSAGDDREAELNIRKHVNLYQVVTTDPNQTQFDLMPMEGRLSKNMLQGTDCYILDCVSELFVWTGSSSTLKIRNGSLKMGADMLEKRKNNIWVSACHREFPGSEQVLFKERFPDWGGSIPIMVQQTPVGLNTATAKAQVKIDVATILKPKAEKEEVVIDDGNGKITCWRVEDFTKIPVDASRYGHFYSGDSYVILYTYIYKNKDCFLIYFWQGKNSSINEKGSSALLTMELDDTLKGMAKEVRVVQNKEPKHFLSIFKSKFIVHQGKDPMSKGYKAPEPNQFSLYHIRGTSAMNTRAVQTYTSPHSLNSYGTYVLASNNGSNTFVWYGKLSNELEKSYAKSIVGQWSSSKTVELNEGQETSAFWDSIGGKEIHPKMKLSSRVEPRLFSCSIGSGIFLVEEVHSFAQDDLLQEDVYIIDGIDHIWVWIGTETTETERKMAMELSLDYATALPAWDGRKDITAYTIYSGKEPFIFTSNFHGWDFAKRKSPLSYESDITLMKSFTSCSI
ncbi:villin [Heterostelium album PN500]|uniref:Villin n=1 Tax=Heterostelium pallidum (strain ATCC 26659 / Pp 5 / PN500) TaxID=670386 RepID=D3BHH2_HETP5|nr:villin [Heterostelium album PN500]EFA79149.1 villin [Heterostelium album PN500]|eukprot:XP_020431271.1 villin [Heterostelium album PN500]